MKDQLGFADVPHSQNLQSRRVHLVTHRGQLLTHERVHQRALSRVRRPTQTHIEDSRRTEFLLRYSLAEEQPLYPEPSVLR